MKCKAMSFFMQGYLLITRMNHLYDEEIERLDWIDEFCQDARKGLFELERQGRLRHLRKYKTSQNHHGDSPFS